MPGHRVLEETVDQVHIVAVKLRPPRDLVARERSTVNDELETEVLHGRAGAAGASRGGAYVAQPAVKQAEGLAQPVGDANIGAQGGAAERIPFDLIDRELAAEAPRDAIHELGDDLLAVLLLGPADECGVSRDVSHDQEPFH